MVASMETLKKKEGGPLSTRSRDELLASCLLSDTAVRILPSFVPLYLLQLLFLCAHSWRPMYLKGYITFIFLLNIMLLLVSFNANELSHRLSPKHFDIDISLNFVESTGDKRKRSLRAGTSGMSGSVSREYKSWLITQEKSSRSASFASFVQEFAFLDLEDAKVAYEMLTSSSRLRGDYRPALVAKYGMFSRSKPQSFWSNHCSRWKTGDQKNMKISVTKAARVVLTASVREIAITARLLENGGGDQDGSASACSLRSKRKIESNIVHQNCKD